MLSSYYVLLRPRKLRFLGQAFKGGSIEIGCAIVYGRAITLFKRMYLTSYPLELDLDG